MAPFLEQSDWDFAMKPELVRQMTGGDTTLQAMAEARAIQKIKSELSSHYDMDYAFEQVGAKRNPLLTLYVAILALHDLAGRVNPNNVGDNLADRYDEVMTFLRNVRKGEAKLDLPLAQKADGNPESDIRFGSNLKQEPNEW